MNGPYKLTSYNHAPYKPANFQLPRIPSPGYRSPSSSSSDEIVLQDGTVLKKHQVLEYLNKKGYSKTEATLRREVADRDHGPVSRKVQEKGPDKYAESYGTTDQEPLPYINPLI